jgi:Fe-S oxidoreductase
MNPTVMLALIVGAHAMFLWSANRRWQLLRIGRADMRFDHLLKRIGGVWRYAFAQERMDYYQPVGIAHKLIFTGFLVLLFRTLVLWGRGFYPAWNLFVLGPSMPLGKVYEFAKDVIGVLVVAGVLVFIYYRAIRKERRMTLSGEGLLILCIIGTMMVADMAYDGACIVLGFQKGVFCAAGGLASARQCAMIDTITAPLGTELHEPVWSAFPSPAGSAFAWMFKSLSPGWLIAIAHIGFWTHSSLVLIFLNLLPHSKHFHVITAIPNVFFRNLAPPGRLEPMAENLEKLMEKFAAVAELPEPTVAAFGVAKVDHFTWKALLDFYTCTECGRCSDNCPAHRTGKVLSPKHFLLSMRDHLYEHEGDFIEREEDTKGKNGASEPKAATESASASATESASESASATESASASASESESATASEAHHYKAIDLVSNIVHPDVLWGCTTCRACEEQCPVMISYVDKIVGMRRNLVMVKGEFPADLNKTFSAIEVNGNPWNLSRLDRAAWSDGLGIPTLAEKPDAEVLYWVGCAAAYDDGAKRVARATAKLLKMAKVDFAILGQEETCTGDPARRAGNEVLFVQLAEANATTLNGYKEKGGMKKVVTACPHCFNTLKNEYPDFGVKLEVVHHTDFLLGLLAEGKLHPTKESPGRVVYHDSCYLGRYNGVYESPREILRRIPGVELVEAEYWNKQRGLCCGAGGAQMWMEEQNKNRVNIKRTLQLVDAVHGNGAPGEKTIASGCPFCKTMLTDGLKSQNLEEKIRQLDVAEILERACEEVVVAPAEVAPEPPPPSPEPPEPEKQPDIQAAE